MSEEDNKTLWCGNLSEQVSEDILYELFLQAGPLEKVRIPRERDGRQKSFAFIVYNHEISVPYAIELFKGTALFNRTLTLRCRVANIRPNDNSNEIQCMDRYNGHDHNMRLESNERKSHREQSFRRNNQRNDYNDYRRHDSNKRWHESQDRNRSNGRKRRR